MSGIIQDVNAIGIRKMTPREALLAEKARDPAAGADLVETKPSRQSAFASPSDQSFERLEERIAALEEAVATLEAARAADAEKMAAAIEAVVATPKPKRAPRKASAQKMSGVREESDGEAL